MYKNIPSNGNTRFISALPPKIREAKQTLIRNPLPLALLKYSAVLTVQRSFKCFTSSTHSELMSDTLDQCLRHSIYKETSAKKHWSFCILKPGKSLCQLRMQLQAWIVQHKIRVADINIKQYWNATVVSKLILNNSVKTTRGITISSRRSSVHHANKRDK